MKKKYESATSLIVPKGVKPEQILKNLHSFEGRIASLITKFAGSMFFVYFHVVWFGAWILLNHSGFKHLVPPFDPFPYGLLTMIVSLEAIFLSTFIIINQNRQALIETYRDLEGEEEEQQQEELEEDVQDIQKDLDDIKNAVAFIQNKISSLEKMPIANGDSASKPE
jgi:uncharacterized membrane protein